MSLLKDFLDESSQSLKSKGILGVTVVLQSSPFRDLVDEIHEEYCGYGSTPKTCHIQWSEHLTVIYGVKT